MWWMTAAIWILWSIAPGRMVEAVPATYGSLEFSLDEMHRALANLTCVANSCIFNEIHPFAVSKKWRESISEAEQLLYFCECPVTTTVSPPEMTPPGSSLDKTSKPPTGNHVKTSTGPSVEGARPTSTISTTEEPTQPLIKTDGEDVEGTTTDSTTTTTTTTTTTEPPTPCPTTPFPEETLPWHQVWAIVEYLAYLDSGTGISDGSTPLSGDKQFDGRTHKAFCYFCQTGWTLLNQEGANQTAVNGLPSNGTFYGKYPGDNQTKQCNVTDICKDYQMDAWKTDCLPTTTTTKEPKPTVTKTTRTTRSENDKAPTTTTTPRTRSPTSTTTGTETTTSTTSGTTTGLRKTTKMDDRTTETTMIPPLPWETTTSSVQTSQPTSKISEIQTTTTTVEEVERSSSTTVTSPVISSTTTITDPTTTTTQTSTNSVGTSEASTTTEEPRISTTPVTTTTALPEKSTTLTTPTTSATTPDQTTTTPLPASLLPTSSETSPSSTSRSDSSTSTTGTMSSEWISLSSFAASTETSATTETSTVASSTSVGTSTMETTDISTTKSTTATVTEPETTRMPSTETSSTDLDVTASTSSLSSTTVTSSEISWTTGSPSTVLSTPTTRQTTTRVDSQEMKTTTEKDPSTTATPSSSTSTTSPSPSPAVISTDPASTSRPESSPVDTSPSVTSTSKQTTSTAEPRTTGITSPPMETSVREEKITTEKTSTSSGHTSSPFSTSSEKTTAQSTTSTSPPSVTSGVPSRSTPATSPSTSSVPPVVPSSSTEIPSSLTNPPVTKGMDSSSKPPATSPTVEATSSTTPTTTTTDGDRREATSAAVPTTSSPALLSSSTPSTTSSGSPSTASTSPASSGSPSSQPSSSSSLPPPTPASTTPETPTPSSKNTSQSPTSTGPKSTSSPASSQSTPSSRRPGTTTGSSKTPPPEWRDCDKVCPPGYEEGENYCYHLIPPYHAAMYTYSLSYCNRNFSIDLADATDFESSTNLALFRTMNASAEMFWINEHRSKALMTTYKVSLVNVTNSTAFRLATYLVRVQARSNMSNGLCRAPKFCAPVNCSISEIYSLIGYLMPPVPDYLPSQFDAGVTFNQPCLPPATNNVTTTCAHFGQWEPHQSRLECVDPDAPLPQKPEKVTFKNKPVRESCDDCHPRGTDNCTEVEGGYKCNCKAGWTKFTCWRSPDHCRKNSCNGHGKCHRMVDTVLCECDQYHSGPTCKKKLLESTWFGENDTVAIISAGTVTAGIYTGNNMLILALKAATKFVTLKEGADPMEQFQQLRVFCLALAGLAVAMFAQPSMFLLNPLMQKMAFFLEQALFGLAFLFYFSEAKQVYWTISGFNRNEWHRDSKKQRHWYLGFLLRNHMPLVAVYAVAAVIAQLSFDRVANYQTTMGLFDEVNSLPMLILVIFHGGFALCAVGAGYDAYRLLKTRPDFYMEICYQAELNKKYIEQDEVRKVGRNVIFMMINPLVLAVSWIALCLSYYLDNVYLDVLCLLLGGLYSVCSTAQSLITHSGNFETLLIKVVFRWLPDWKWLPRVTPLSRLTREEVQCAYQKKRLSSIEYPFQPTLDYWYLRDEERYWIHRNLTQKYCEQRFKTGNTPNECIHTVTLDELTKAFDCDDQEMIYWIGIWAEQIRRHDRFDIRQSRDIINRPQDIMYRAMMAPLMTEGMKKEEERKCQRYQDLADLLKYTEVDQKDVKMPVNRLPGASWIEWLSFNGPVRLRPIFPQYVLREQHALTFRAADKILEMLKSEGPDGEDDYNNWLYDEERPGFIGPHKDPDFRYFPGAREMLDCWGASRPFRDEMKRLEESRNRWIREEVTGVIEPDRPAAPEGGEGAAAPEENQPGDQGAAEDGQQGGEEVAQGIEEPAVEEGKPGPSGVETN